MAGLLAVQTPYLRCPSKRGRPIRGLRITAVTGGTVRVFSGGTVRLTEGVRLDVGDHEAHTPDGSLLIAGYAGKPFTLYAADDTQLYPR